MPRPATIRPQRYASLAASLNVAGQIGGQASPGAAAMAVVAAGGLFTAVSHAQEERSIQDGVYTAEQAKRGETIFKDHCSVCHADDLTGADGPARKCE